MNAMCVVRQCSYTDSNSAVNLGNKRLELKGTVFKWLCRTSGIRTVHCVEMFNDVRNTNMRCSANRKSGIVCLVHNMKVENVLRRISNDWNGN
jgi:hypothetical protein